MYLTADETTTLLAAYLPSTDRRRVAFAALSADDQAVACERAALDFDAAPWIGTREEEGQAHAFPRTGVDGARVAVRDDPGIPGGGAWSVEGIPYEVRVAVAIQTGLVALRGLGQDEGQQIRELAHQGVTSRGRGGKSASIDLRVAMSGWAAIDPEAQRWAGTLRRVSGGIV